MIQIYKILLTGFRPTGLVTAVCMILLNTVISRESLVKYFRCGGVFSNYFCRCFAGGSLERVFKIQKIYDSSDICFLFIDAADLALQVAYRLQKYSPAIFLGYPEDFWGPLSDPGRPRHRLKVKGPDIYIPGTTDYRETRTAAVYDLK